MKRTTEFIDYKNNDFYFLYIEKIEDEGLTDEKWHEHSFYEITFIVNGECEYEIENRRYAMKKGDALLIKPGEYHFKYKNVKTPISTYCLGFLPSAVENAGLAERIFEKCEFFSLDDGSPITEMLDAVKKKLKFSKSNASLFIKSVTEAIILMLLDLDLDEKKIPETKNRNVQKMIDYIKENLPSIKRVEDISSALFFSDSYTRTLFKKEMNMGIMEYVRNKKVLLAHRKIRHGKKPSEVYAECGFSNYTSFYRAYNAYLGHSPKMQKI